MSSYSLKLAFGQEIHKISKAPEDLNEIRDKIQELFKTEIPSKYLLQYEDTDEKKVALKNQEDYDDLMRIDAKSKNKLRKLWIAPARKVKDDDDDDDDGDDSSSSQEEDAPDNSNKLIINKNKKNPSQRDSDEEGRQKPAKKKDKNYNKKKKEDDQSDEGNESYVIERKYNDNQSQSDDLELDSEREIGQYLKHKEEKQKKKGLLDDSDVKPSSKADKGRKIDYESEEDGINKPEKHKPTPQPKKLKGSQVSEKNAENIEFKITRQFDPQNEGKPFSFPDVKLFVERKKKEESIYSDPQEAAKLRMKVLEPIYRNIWIEAISEKLNPLQKEMKNLKEDLKNNLKEIKAFKEQVIKQRDKTTKLEENAAKLEETVLNFKASFETSLQKIKDSLLPKPKEKPDSHSDSSDSPTSRLKSPRPHKNGINDSKFFEKRPKEQEEFQKKKLVNPPKPKPPRYDIELVEQGQTTPKTLVPKIKEIFLPIKIKNTGPNKLPEKCILKHTFGAKGANVKVPDIPAGKDSKVLLSLEGPDEPGKFRSLWKLVYNDEDGEENQIGQDIVLKFEVLSIDQEKSPARGEEKVEAHFSFKYEDLSPEGKDKVSKLIKFAPWIDKQEFINFVAQNPNMNLDVIVNRMKLFD